MFARRCTFLKDEEPNKLGSRKEMGVHREAESEGGRMLGENGEPWWGNFWPDERKPHRRIYVRVRLTNKPDPNSHTESHVIDAVGR